MTKTPYLSFKNAFSNYSRVRCWKLFDIHFVNHFEVPRLSDINLLWKCPFWSHRSPSEGRSPFGAARFPSEHPVPIWPVATLEYVQVHLDLDSKIPFKSLHSFTPSTTKLLDSFGNNAEKWKQANLIRPHCLVHMLLLLYHQHLNTFGPPAETLNLCLGNSLNLCELQWFIKLKNLATGR